MISFTDRELKSAWRQSRSAFEDASTKTNAHRLLLFYAVEAGLKAAYLKRNHATNTNAVKSEFSDIQHNLNKLLDKLRVDQALRLPSEICMDDLRPSIPRKPSSAKLNEVWRYGAHAKNPTDEQLENKLIAILDWIDGELR